MVLHKMFASTPKFGASDIVGRVRSGAQIQGRPVALQEWRFTTGDPDVAQAVADKYGGSPQDWTTTTEESLEVMSTVGSLPVILTAIQSEFVLWVRNSVSRSCDGSVQKDDACTGCVCPSDVK